MDDLFDDIPDDLASLPIDDLLFSDYLDSMSAHLLEPSSDSADAGFSGSHSENQQIDGLSPSYSVTHSSSRNQSNCFDPQFPHYQQLGHPQQGSYDLTPPGSYLDPNQGQCWAGGPQVSHGMGGDSQPLPPVISLGDLSTRGSLAMPLPPLDSMDLTLPHFDLLSSQQGQQNQQPVDGDTLAWDQAMLLMDGNLNNYSSALPPGTAPGHSPGLHQIPPVEPPGSYFEAGPPMGQPGQIYASYLEEPDSQGVAMQGEQTGSHGMNGNNHDDFRDRSEGSLEHANSGNTGFPVMPDVGSGDLRFTGGAVGGDKKGGRRNRNRTEHQQNLNKLAQQRYRERKKQKAIETEQAAAQLASRIKDFNFIKERYRQLSDDNEALQASLNNTDNELIQLHAEQAAASVSSRPAAIQELEIPDNIVPALQKSAEALRLALASCRGAPPEAALEDPSLISDEVLNDIEGLVEAMNALFLQLQCLEGVDVWQAYAAFTQGKACPANCSCYFCQQKAAGEDFASGLHLTQEQHRKIEFVRENHVKKLQGIYAERQKLNLEAVRVMLPKGYTGPSGAVGSYEFLGFFQRAKQSANVTTVLDNLKDNLRAEQRATAEVDFMTFKRILNPVQGAHFILQSYPAKADAVGLGRAVNYLPPTALKTERSS